MPESYDVVVVGGGNAGLCAALAAAEQGAHVCVLERAPRRLRGGNSRFTAGAMRVVFRDVADLQQLMPSITADELSASEFGDYSAAQFLTDLARVTDFRTDPDLAEVLVSKSFETLTWMTTKGVEFLPSYGRQAFKVDGRFRFWGGLAVEVNGGGEGLIEALAREAVRAGITILYQARGVSLINDDDGVHGVTANIDGRTRDIPASGVVLAAGGFQANAEWRARYLGPGWDLAKVRGTRFNTGDGIRMALDVGADPCGHWSGCHAVAWDRNAPDFGDLRVGDGFQKHSYPLGIIVNDRGERFLDEGADFRNFTYAKYGHEILKQPHQVAWQVFDGQVLGLLRDEYRISETTKVVAETLEDLAAKLGREGVDQDAFLETVQAFNRSVTAEVPFNPAIRDGRSAVLPVPKTNWANPLLEPPFVAYQVTCGITFTFGGIRIDRDARVLDVEGRPIPGLLACGELVGGLFYFNYPGGTGLTSGSVFGKIAGAGAGQIVASARK